MIALVETVRNKVDEACLVNSCSKEGCKVLMKEAPQSRLIVDFDKPNSPLGQNQTRCYYLFIAESPDKCWVVPMELKKGKVDASRAIEQLKAGAKVADNLIPKHLSVAFHPVIVSKGINKVERTAMKDPRNRVMFHGRPAPVSLIDCGAALMTALPNS